MKRPVLTLIGALMISAAAPAQKLDSICYTVALEAPSLKAQETRIAAQRLQNEADNSLAGPEADFDYKFNASGGENRWGVSVGQGFDWPGVYYSRRKSNKLRESALENLHRQNVADKALEIKLAAIRLGQARQNVRVLGEAKSNFEELVAKMKYAFDRSETTILNLRKSELQLMSVNSTLAEAENELSQAEAALEAVAPGALSRFDGVEGVEIAQLKPEQVYLEALNASSGMMSVSTEAEAARNDISVAKRAAMPSFKLSYVHDYEEFTHFNGFGISIALPSWQPAKNVALARANAIAADLDAVDYGIVQRARLHADYTEAARLYARIADQQELLASDYPALLKKAFDASIITVFDYLREYNDYLDTLSRHNALVAGYAGVEARLAKNFLK